MYILYIMGFIKCAISYIILINSFTYCFLHRSMSFQLLHKKSFYKSLMLCHKNDKKEFKIEKGFLPKDTLIRRVTFDKISENIYQIKKTYMTYNSDRIIFEYNDEKRVVYYINNKDELLKIKNLMYLIPNNTTNIIICDKNVMNDSSGFLFCESNDVDL